METLKEYAALVNPHWIAVVATGMYTHLRQICVIGLCLGAKSEPPFDTCYASVLFTFSVLCLLAEYRLWPRTLKEPPIQLLYIYEMLIAALTTDLAERVVWTPLMHAVYCLTQESSKWLLWLNDTIDLGYSSYLEAFAQYMAGDQAPTHVSFCLSLLSFVWMLDATETLDAILDTWAKGEQRREMKSCECNRKSIRFARPEVSDWFAYKLLRRDQPETTGRRPKH